tara:strand:- start:967 stop:1251 length:285 start_codon:yes stop_codon:yes gene_type:complete
MISQGESLLLVLWYILYALKLLSTSLSERELINPRVFMDVFSLPTCALMSIPVGEAIGFMALSAANPDMTEHPDSIITMHTICRFLKTLTFILF